MLDEERLSENTCVQISLDKHETGVRISKGLSIMISKFTNNQCKISFCAILFIICDIVSFKHTVPNGDSPFYIELLLNCVSVLFFYKLVKNGQNRSAQHCCF